MTPPQGEPFTFSSININFFNFTAKPPHVASDQADSTVSPNIAVSRAL